MRETIAFILRTMERWIYWKIQNIFDSTAKIHRRGASNERRVDEEKKIALEYLPKAYIQWIVHGATR